MVCVGRPQEMGFWRKIAKIKLAGVQDAEIVRT